MRGFGSAGTWLRALGAVLVLNLLFLLANLWVASLPTEPLADRVRAAFAAGDLTTDDVAVHDTRRGISQYNDCLILQMLLNDGQTALEKATGPLLQVRDETYSGYCAALHDVATGADTSGYTASYTYTRYWHGYMPLTAALLSVLDLRTLRQGLKEGVYASLLLLAIAAAASGDRRLLALGVSVAGTGILFWGLPYYGQSLSHAPGDIGVLLGLAALLYWRRVLGHPSAFLPFCAAFGAVVTYLEFLTGQLPTAAGLLLAAAYAVARLRPGPEGEPGPSAVFAATGLAAFVLGAVATVAIKQGLAWGAFGPGAADRFVGSLMTYAGADAGTNPLERYAGAVLATLGRAGRLNGGSMVLLLAVYAASAGAWVLAIRVARRSPGPGALPDLLAFAAGAAVIAAWILLLPVHARAHPWMSRILIVPIALGFAALAWQWQLRSQSRRDRAAEGPAQP